MRYNSCFLIASLIFIILIESVPLNSLIWEVCQIILLLQRITMLQILLFQKKYMYKSTLDIIVLLFWIQVMPFKILQDSRLRPFSFMKHQFVITQNAMAHQVIYTM